MDFRKAFNIVPQHEFMDRLQRLSVPKIEFLAIWTLYETLSSCVCIPEGLLDNILSTIGVKQVCPLSPTSFGLYIDELESFILETINPELGCLLHDNRVSILPFVDDIVLLSHSVEDQQGLIVAFNAK